MKRLITAVLTALALATGFAQAQTVTTNCQVTGIGMCIGGSIGGGTATRILFVGTGGVLDDAATLIFDESTVRLTVGTGSAGGIVIVGGTVTAASSSPFLITRTNNHADVDTGVKWTFTDTTSAAGFLPWQVLGTSSGTASLASLNKSGGLTAVAFQVSTAPSGVDRTVIAGALGGGGLGLSVDKGSVIGLGQSGTDASSPDTAFSRISAGVIGVGTGAAGSVAGQLHAGMLQASLGTALTLTAGAVGMSKMTASGSAPGATGAKLEIVCGTNAGSAKLTVLAGTSTTPVTVVDNIGSGVTGC